jgi:alpha-aminoadipate carrier protein LysW
MTGLCPECDTDINLSPKDNLNEIVTCEECGVDLEIVGLDPVEFEIVEEDYEYDEDEDEDDY